MPEDRTEDCEDGPDEPAAIRVGGKCGPGIAQTVTDAGDHHCPEQRGHGIEHGEADRIDACPAHQDGTGDAQADEKADRQNQPGVMPVQQRLEPRCPARQGREPDQQRGSPAPADLEPRLIAERTGHRRDGNHGGQVQQSMMRRGAGGEQHAFAFQNRADGDRDVSVAGDEGSQRERHVCRTLHVTTGPGPGRHYRRWRGTCLPTCNLGLGAAVVDPDQTSAGQD